MKSIIRCFSKNEPDKYKENFMQLVMKKKIGIGKLLPPVTSGG
jgi:hypothetical protein